MASTVALPEKSTRQMTELEVRAEAARFGLPAHGDLQTLRRALSDEIGRRWKEDNCEAIAAMNRWIDEHGLPLEKYRLW